MPTVVVNLLFLVALGFVGLCWVMVIAHQLDWQPFNVARYPALAGSLYFAYVIAPMSACIFIVAVLLSFKK